MMADVITIGETMAVVYPQQPVTLDLASAALLDVAGAESNVAIRLRQLGHSVAFISRVGDDPFGRMIRAALDGFGVQTDWLTVDAQAQTGVFFREALPDGARRVYYYRAASAASRLSPADLNAAQFHGARVVHLTGITPALSESCAATVRAAIALGRRAGATIAFDPNYRAKLWSPEVARAALLPLLGEVDLLLLGHEDAVALFGSDDEAAVAAAAQRFGIGTVVLKLAERGALALRGGQRVARSAVPVDRVVDPVGAGDAFDAGFLAGLLRGYELERCVDLGNRCGAIAVAHLGDYAGELEAG